MALKREYWEDSDGNQGERVVTDGSGRQESWSNDAIQIGGSHYKEAQIEPWNYIWANGLGYFEGNAVKYITRWKVKGGTQDLEKAVHYLNKLIELQKEKQV